MNKNLRQIKEIREQKYMDEFFYQFERDGVGIPISDIKNPEAFGDEEYGTIVDETEDVSSKRFAEEDYISVYKYETMPGEGADIIETSREFCKRMMRTDRVYSRSDISRLQNMNGSSVYKWRGSYGCRHYFVRYTYDPTTRELIRKTFIQPRQPSTKVNR